MEIDEFIALVNNKAEKKPKYGDEYYRNIDLSYYKKLSVCDNGNFWCPQNRLSYEVIWDKNNYRRNIFILFNPSIANSKILDGTLKNCAKICYAINQNIKNEIDKCGGMLIYNTFTVRHPQIEIAIKNIDIKYEKNNNPLFKLSENYPDNISYLIIAWGNDAKNKLNAEYYEKLKELISKLYKQNHKIYAYHLNTTGAKQPSHPSPRCTKYVKEFIKAPNLIELNSKNFML